MFMRASGTAVFPLRSAGRRLVRRLGPKAVPNSYSQLHVCTSSTDEDKSYVYCLTIYLPLCIL